jgi:hypothetical protein
VNKSPKTASPESPYGRRLLAILKDLRGGRDPHETLVAITSALVVASRDAAVTAGAQLTFFPKAHHVGYNRYGFMQDAFYKIGKELGLPMDIKKHPGGSTSYALLEHDRLRVTLGSVLKYNMNPPLHPFRRSSGLARFRPWQLDLLEELPPPDTNQVVTTFVFGFERSNNLTPYFLEARFIEGDHYVNEIVDLLDLWKQSQVPNVETVAPSSRPILRTKKHVGIQV